MTAMRVEQLVDRAKVLQVKPALLLPYIEYILSLDENEPSSTFYSYQSAGAEDFSVLPMIGYRRLPRLRPPLVSPNELTAYAVKAVVAV